MLPDPQIRQELSALTDWPTIPQVFVKGELIGGADITEELYASGELARKLDDALGAEREQVVKTVAMGPAPMGLTPQGRPRRRRTSAPCNGAHNLGFTAPRL